MKRVAWRKIARHSAVATLGKIGLKAYRVVPGMWTASVEFGSWSCGRSAGTRRAARAAAERLARRLIRGGGGGA